MASGVRAARFFVAGVFAPGDIVQLAGEDARKLTVVLRKATGDELEIVDSAGRAFAATLVLEGSGAGAVLVREVAAPRAPALRITLAQGIPKGSKMDFVVEKATELGVAAVLPFASERTVVDGPREGKLERWRRVARSAAQQCGRSDVPEIAAPLAFRGLVEYVAATPLALVPWELAEPVPLRTRLPPLLAGRCDVLLVIGPEGGLSHAEAQALGAAGAHLLSLGSRILRTETAGLVACSALLYETADL
jgi:16S rRNA (uracil1498-N3)-methyltransferase